MWAFDALKVTYWRRAGGTEGPTARLQCEADCVQANSSSSQVRARPEPRLCLEQEKHFVYAPGPFTAQTVKEGNQLVPGSPAANATSTDDVSISHPTDGVSRTEADFTKWTSVFFCCPIHQSKLAVWETTPQLPVEGEGVGA